VIGPLTAESIANIDPSTHVISGHYAVALSSVREFLVGLASWVDTLLNEADESDQNGLQHDIALVYVTTCDQIHEISAYQDRNNNAMVDPSSIPQCYRMSLSSYSQPTSFKRFGNMLSDWIIVTHQLRSISSLMSTKP
jgi:hypothetical protein